MMQFIRHTIERLARGRSFTRRLPNGARLVVSPDAQMKYVRRSFDADLAALARDHVKVGDTVWDIGANCGVFAFNCAHAARVFAVEADPFLGSLIQRSIAYGDAPVSLVAGAIYSETGLAEFAIANRGRAGNHLAAVSGSTRTGGERSRLLVPTFTLDELLARIGKPDFVKIDIEGAELAALQGAAKLLQDARPILYIESGHETRDAIQCILQNARYQWSTRDQSNWLCIPEN